MLVGIVLAGLVASATAEPQIFESGEARVRLVELYTSEGCSSCPPADRFVSGLVDDPRVWSEIVPVAFHVDYWDYIGWPDRFASPAFSERQRQHAHLGHVRNVYTPGFVVGGKEWRGFFRRQAIPDAEPVPIGSLALSVDGDAASARFVAKGLPEQLELHVALLGFDLATQVRAGENHGRRLEHDFVVLSYARAYLDATPEGYVAPVQIPPPSTESPRTAIAAWVTPVDDTLPIQAVGGWLNPPPPRTQLP